MNQFLRVCALALVAGVALAMPVEAADYYWNLGTGSGYINDGSLWSDAGSTPGTAPGEDDIAHVSNPGMMLIDATHQLAGRPDTIYLGDGAVANVQQTGGDLSFKRWLYVGLNTGTSSSTYDMQGGTIGQVAPTEGNYEWLIIGQSGAATMSMSGTASVDILSSVQVGALTGGDGTLSMTGDSFFRSASGIYVSLVGDTASTTGHLNMTGSSDVECASMTVGYSNATGHLNMNVGDLSSAKSTLTTSDLTLGIYGGGVAHATLANQATINVVYAANIGLEGASGTMTMGGGNATTPGSRMNVGSDLNIGRANGGTGHLTLHDYARVDVTGWANIGFNWGAAGSGTLDMDGHSIFNAANSYLGYNMNVKGTVNLDDNAVYTNAGEMYLGFDGDNVVFGEGEVNVRGNATLNTAMLMVSHYQGGIGTVTLESTSATPSDTAKVNVTSALGVGVAGGRDGEIIIGDRGVMTVTGEAIYVGGGDHSGARSNGVVTMNGGVFDYSAATGTLRIGTQYTHGVSTGLAGNGTWTMNDGTVEANALGVILGQGDLAGGAGGTATLNLNGGVFEAAFVRTGASAPASATVNFNGGTLRAVADSSNFVGDDGATPVLVANVQAGGAVIDTNGFNVTIDAALVEDAGSPNGGLMKLGLGVLSLGGTSTFTGDTTVVGGALDLDGALAGDVCVNAGAALMGNGSIGGKLDVATGGSIAPGGSIGTLAVSGNVTLCGTLDVEYNSDDGTTDRLDVDGILTVAGGTLSFTDLGSSGYTGPYVIASYGTLVGEPAIELGLPAGWSVDYSYNGNQIAIVPEPGMAVFLITALWALAWRRKWRQTKHTP